MILTIGTALSRARDEGVMVKVLVEGQWFEGLVQGSDGTGVVLTNEQGDVCVTRIERISSVLLEGAASERSIPSQLRPHKAS